MGVSGHRGSRSARETWDIVRLILHDFHDKFHTNFLGGSFSGSEYGYRSVCLELPLRIPGYGYRGLCEMHPSALILPHLSLNGLHAILGSLSLSLEKFELGIHRDGSAAALDGVPSGLLVQQASLIGHFLQLSPANPGDGDTDGHTDSLKNVRPILVFLKPFLWFLIGSIICWLGVSCFYRRRDFRGFVGFPLLI